MDKVFLTCTPKNHHANIRDNFRGSNYRGVSVNGKSWQILILIDSEKYYLCTTDDQEIAAKLYDIVII